METPSKRSSTLDVIRSLATSVWKFRDRVMISVALLVFAKVATVSVPLVLKEIVDALSQPGAVQFLPAFLLLADHRHHVHRVHGRHDRVHAAPRDPSTRAEGARRDGKRPTRR